MKKVKLEQISWQIVAMFIAALAAVTIAYVLTTMSPEQYYSILQLLLSFFAGYVFGGLVQKTGETKCQ
jgi:phosphate starvation-inducible membrane PsiE